MEDKFQKLKESYDNIVNKKSKFIFFVPNIQVPSAIMYEIYVHANVLKEDGYDVQMMLENAQCEKPTWFESSLTELPHIFADKHNLTIRPEDFLMIPDIYTNIMEQVKNITCEKIVLLFSHDYALNALVPAMYWKDLGISKVLTTNEKLKATALESFGMGTEIQSYNIGIPNYFKPSPKPKKLVISFLTRNGNDLTKVVKMFYYKYPQYRFVSFEDLSGMSREQFAQKLGESFATLWIDRIASFGTLALEAMKSNNILVGLVPDIQPDYLKEGNALWTYDLYNMPDILAQAINMHLQDLPAFEELEKSMKETVEKYSVDESKKQLKSIYGKYIEDRIKLLENAIIANTTVEA
jgi:hypothetical protein